MTPERFEVSGSLTFHFSDPELLKDLWSAQGSWAKWADPASRADMRALALSRLSGLDVMVDLTMFDLAWSPIYRAGAGEEPIAWVHNTTGVRQTENPYG